MSPRHIVIAASVALALVGLGFLGLYLVAASREDTIADGMRIGLVDLGGLTVEEAERRVEDRLMGPLRKPLVVRSGEEAFPLSAKEARITANISATVREALRRSQEGSWLSRGVREVTGDQVDATITPVIAYDRPAIQRLIDKIRVRMTRDPRNATVAWDAKKGVRVHRARMGRTIDTRVLRARMWALVNQPGAKREIRAKLIKTRPKTDTAQIAKRYPVLLTVDRRAFRIRLFKNLKRVKSFPIAVGQVGLDTPSGRFKIQNKSVNPAWHVPNSAWAGSLAGSVIPGGLASNPLKSRWMGVAGGVGVHGTADRASMGHNASHGCIRMLVEDVEELYDAVPVGTPIFIS